MVEILNDASNYEVEANCIGDDCGDCPAYCDNQPTCVFCGDD